MEAAEATGDAFVTGVFFFGLMVGISLSWISKHLGRLAERIYVKLNDFDI